MGDHNPQKSKHVLISEQGIDLECAKQTKERIIKRLTASNKIILIE